MTVLVLYRHCGPGRGVDRFVLVLVHMDRTEREWLSWTLVRTRYMTA